MGSEISQAPRPSLQKIAENIGYPKSTVTDHIKNLHLMLLLQVTSYLSVLLIGLFVWSLIACSSRADRAARDVSSDGYATIRRTDDSDLS